MTTTRGAPVRQCCPDPVVIAVDVDGEYVVLGGDAVGLKERLDVGRGHRGADATDAGPVPVALGQPGELDVINFEEQAAPALFQRQQSAVALAAGLNAELDEEAVGRADAVEDLLQDAVLAVLRVHAFLERPQVADLRPAGLDGPPLRVLESFDGLGR
jgi:hypothetical protein